jgi:hypothetical protein
VYDRTIDNQELTFEPSGGLINSSLVMQDRETDSYWPIMRGSAAAGSLKGTELNELAVNRKMKWKDWKRRHPDTLVLSVNGKEDDKAAYDTYFKSRQGFRGARAIDKRLQTKDSVFVFRIKRDSYAVYLKNLGNGKTWSVSGKQVFLYRHPSAKLHDSTLAFVSKGNSIVSRDGNWIDESSGCSFDPTAGEFRGGRKCPAALAGFDTFWYNWSLNNPDTQLLAE